jgi:lipopolysaccharide/colanic/teichoic acid biosynthesis glycosyltransferase
MYMTVKRFVDVVAAAVVMLLLSPLMLVIALAIKRDSSGGFLFRQERVGKDGRPFTIYKFRSMVVEAPAYTFKIRSDDLRITRVGRLLRLSGLDEMPQLFNVVKGDMSLIGPRPELQFIVDQYEPWQRQRHSVTPGITGWWQIHHRNEVPMHHGVVYDLYYIENLGPRLDALIALRTVKIMLLGFWQGVTGTSPNDA